MFHVFTSEMLHEIQFKIYDINTKMISTTVSHNATPLCDVCTSERLCCGYYQLPSHVVPDYTTSKSYDKAMCAEGRRSEATELITAVIGIRIFQSLPTIPSIDFLRIVRDVHRNAFPISNN